MKNIAFLGYHRSWIAFKRGYEDSKIVYNGPTEFRTKDGCCYRLVSRIDVAHGIEWDTYRLGLGFEKSLDILKVIQENITKRGNK